MPTPIAKPPTNLENGARPLLELLDLKTWFPVRRGVFAKTIGHVRAVDGVTLTIARAETLGLVGESGCGKTTLGRTILGLDPPHSGRLRFDGRDIGRLSRAAKRQLRQRMQIIFQDPLSSLNPRMNILDIVTEGLREFSLISDTREAHAVRLLREVGLDADALYRYPHEFSGGQRQRINVARAISLRPDFIVCDEAVSALDVSVQAQVINLMIDLREKYGLAYLFISHDLSVVSNIAGRVAVMYLGRVVEEGPTDSIIRDPLHPYTRALIGAVPVPGVQRAKAPPLTGETPSPLAPPPGCRFHPRCQEAMDVCRRVDPGRTRWAGRRVWCHLYGEGETLSS
ncbi:MAG: ABC transporter ATP-binding protein [Desulfobacteraceae bacterium]|nr:ABC transporter ATP-binding protein [Desulfobacteraceae bacterium]